MNLVVGSTGILGSEICRRLAAAGQPVRGLVRPTSSPEKVAQLKALGVQIVLGDLREPHSLQAACRGAEVVISSASALLSPQPGDSISVTDQQGQLDLVQAARQAGVSRFVLVSIFPGLEACPLATAKQAVEQAVQSSGLEYAILRPGLFIETWLSPALGFDYSNAQAVIYGEGHAPNGYISLGDVAQTVVESLVKPVAAHAVYEISLPDVYNQLEVVRIFEQVSGKSFKLQFVPAATLEAQRAAATNSFQISLAALIHQMAMGTQLDSTAARRAFQFHSFHWNITPGALCLPCKTGARETLWKNNS